MKTEKLNTIIHGTYKLEQLIKMFRPYFFKITGNFTTNQTIKEDLICVADVSLWQSNENFDSTKECTFFTYVIQQARFAMLNYLNQKGTTHQTIFIPSNQKENFNLTTISMDIPVCENKTISDTIIDEVEQDIEDDRIVALRTHMKKLKPRYQDILTVKYEGWSDTDVAYVSGVTKQFVGQIVHKSIKTLQKEFGLPQVGLACSKHTKLTSKERALRDKHGII